MASQNDHPPQNIHQPAGIFAGLRIVQKIIRWLIHMVIPTEEELIEAGIYPDNPQL